MQVKSKDEKFTEYFYLLSFIYLGYRTDEKVT